MPSYCCVPKCKESGGFLFPKDKLQRKKWQVVFKREDKKKCLWEPSEHSIICHKHFKSSDFLEPKVTYGEKRRKVLKADAVPSLFSFRRDPSEESTRGKRYKERSLKFPGKLNSEFPIAFN